MGRRKIEIKAIKDDRNRSVTFLKRKGGLFKKAHELSVLCSVDVAVIIFGNNKKLYEYSSSDLGEILTRYQFYGGANEHKGPADFNGKDKLDDDDDDDASVPSHHGSVEPQMMPPQFQTQVAYQHIRQHTSSASPPTSSRSIFPHQPQRQQTSQPQLPDRRPVSRNSNTRTSSNLVPQRSQPSNGYSSYMSNPAVYNSQNVAVSSSQPHNLPSHLQAPSMQGPPIQNHTLQGSQYTSYPISSYPQFHSHQQQMRHTYQEDQRKVCMPSPTPQERIQSRSESTPPQPTQQASEPTPPEVKVKQEPQTIQKIPEPVKRTSSKSRSIFTPIDESRSILSQHWASSTSKVEATLSETSTPPNGRLRQVEPNTNNSENYPAPPVCAPTQTSSHSSTPVPENIQRSSHASSTSQGGAKRPILKVQIPDEPSDDGSATADSASSPAGTNATSSHSRQNGNTTDSLSSGLVLPPPPSPSAGSLISAGATGPLNPFARPPPVTQNPQNNANHNNSINGNNNNITSNGNINSINHAIDTPVSALPSRFMPTEFLPSPSSFYPEWNFRSGDGNTLPSPLNFGTPVLGTGPSFMREDATGKEVMKENQNKRNTSEEEADSQSAKRLKKE